MSIQEMMQKLNLKPNTTECLQSSTVKCPKCRDTGWEQYEVDGRLYVRECGCGIRQKQILDKKLEFANIPSAFKGLAFDDFRVDLYKAQDRAKHVLDSAKYLVNNYADMNGVGLYMYSGTRGSGKTRLAAVIANELANKNVSVKFATSIEIINEIKATWNTDSDEGELLRDLSRAEVLIIDDFGTEKVKDWIEERFYHVINTRYIDKKMTLYTSNMSISELDYDERIKNRVLERTYQVLFPEESIRVQIAEENKKKVLKGLMDDRLQIP